MSTVTPPPHVAPPMQTAGGTRNLTGWALLVLFFGLLIPFTIWSSYASSDPDSHSPNIQLDNLEAIVGERTKTQPHTKDLNRLLRALPPSDTSENAAVVRTLACRELGIAPTSSDLQTLATSKLPNHQALAALVEAPSTAPAEVRAKASSLKMDSFVYRLAKAQALQSIGDMSGRYEVSPEYGGPHKVPNAVKVMGGLFVLGLLIGLGLLILYFSRLGTGEIQWKGHPLRTESLVEADAQAIRTVQFLLVFIFGDIIAGYAAMVLFRGSTISATMLQELFVSASILVVSLLLTRLRVSGYLFDLKRYGISVEAILPSIAWGIGGFFAALPLVTLFAALGTLLEKVSPRPDHPITHLLDRSTSPWMLLITFFLASVQAPITEELTFRGTLVPALAALWSKKRGGLIAAIGVAGLLFASLHPQGFSMWLALGSVGVVNTVLCYQTRSVLPGMVMHCLFNGAILVSALLNR